MTRLLCYAVVMFTVAHLVTEVKPFRKVIGLNNWDDKRKDFGCTSCRAGMQTLLSVYNILPKKDVPYTAANICNGLGIFPVDVCEGMATNTGEELMFVLGNMKHSFSTACDLFFQACDSPLPPWRLPVPAGKPAALLRLSDDVKMLTRLSNVQGPESMRILHITDTHLDRSFKESSLANCKHPRCCREEYNSDRITEDPVYCGRFGTEGGWCDMPQRTLDVALSAARDLKPDMIYFTGDIPAHDIWLQTHESNLRDIRHTTDLLKEYFPDIPIVYCLGNHDAAPVNSYRVPSVYQHNYTMEHLYPALPEIWGAAGLPQEEMASVRKGGYYSWLVKPKLRVVALNTNYGAHDNIWMLMEHEDPTNQLSWLSQVLVQAERNDEKVHLLLHHSPGETMTSFSRALNQLLSRFENTVVGVFAGHGHSDMFHVMFDADNNTRPVGVAYVAPSLSSDGLKSPSFRIYEVDGEYDGATWEVKDAMTYSMNLTQANRGAEPAFPLAYSSKKAYNLTNLSPESWASLAWRMASDDHLLYEFFKHHQSFQLEPRQQWEDCNRACRASLLEYMYTGNAADGQPAGRIADKYRASHPEPKL